MATEKFVSFYVRIISIYHQQPTENVIMSNKCTFFLLRYLINVLVLFIDKLQ